MKNPVVTITMENGGVMKVELYPDKAPNTVNNLHRHGRPGLLHQGRVQEEPFPE